MDSPAFLRYVTRVKRSSLLFPLILFFGMATSGLGFAQASPVSALVISADTVPFSDFVRSIEAEGGKIQKRIPPRILIASWSDGTPPAVSAIIRSITTTSVPINELKQFGPAAVAAGLEWNRNTLTTQRKGLGLMSAQAVERVSPAPAGLRTEVRGAVLHCEWQPGEGALFYEVRLANNPSSVWAKTATERTQADLPLPSSTGPQTLTLSVRASDSIRTPETQTEPLNSAWSDIAVSIPPLSFDTSDQPAVLTSPADDVESEGLLVILEWANAQNTPVRLQVALSESFESPLIDEVVTGGEFTCPASVLTVGQRYVWRAKRWESGSVGPWSGLRHFRTGSPGSIANDMKMNPEAPR